MKKPPKPKVYESAVVRACLDWLNRRGCYVWRNNTGSYKPQNNNCYIKYGFPGSADIIGVTPSGRFIGVECKGSSGKLSAMQDYFGRNITQHGGIYIVVYSLDDLEQRKKEIFG